MNRNTVTRMRPVPTPKGSLRREILGADYENEPVCTHAIAVPRIANWAYAPGFAKRDAPDTSTPGKTRCGITIPTTPQGFMNWKEHGDYVTCRRCQRKGTTS